MVSQVPHSKCLLTVSFKPVTFLFGAHPDSHFYFFNWLLPIASYSFHLFLDPIVLGRHFFMSRKFWLFFFSVDLFNGTVVRN